MFRLNSCVLRLGAPLIAALLVAGIGCRGDAGHLQSMSLNARPAQTLYTATSQVRALIPSGEGLWAATAGGVLCWSSLDGLPRTWTTAQGLPSNDVLAVAVDGRRAVVMTRLGRCTIDERGSVVQSGGGDSRQSGAASSFAKGPVCAVDTPSTMASCDPAVAQAMCTAGSYRASPAGLLRQIRPGAWQPVNLPTGSPASYVSALAPCGSHVVAALYGDGLYCVTGDRWSPVESPRQFKMVTALAVVGGRLVAATVNNGVWSSQLGRAGLPANDWSVVPSPPTTPSADIQSVAAWDGKLWAATFDQGLVCIDGPRIGVSGRAQGLSSDDIRELIPAGGQLYARTADSGLDEFDGQSWHQASWVRNLPRRDVYCAAYSDDCLTLGGWGGWASVHGTAITPHYTDSALAGQVATCIANAGGRVWIGTEGKGLLAFENGAYTEYHEAQGITDDWITAIGVHGCRVLVGTYTGGLLEQGKSRFETILKPGKYAIRAIGFDDVGDTYVATPLGVYRALAASPHTWALLDPHAYGGGESQCLCPVEGGMWIGGRAALGFIPGPPPLPAPPMRGPTTITDRQ